MPAPRARENVDLAMLTDSWVRVRPTPRLLVRASRSQTLGFAFGPHHGSLLEPRAHSAGSYSLSEARCSPPSPATGAPPPGPPAAPVAPCRTRWRSLPIRPRRLA